MARLIGLNAAALVDHNSVSGNEEFFREGKRIGLETWGGTELGTGIPGCEILVYFPDPDAFLKFLKGETSGFFRSVLARRQNELHHLAVRAIPEMNRILMELGKRDLITEDALTKWYSGVPPFYPGTLSVLLLERLSFEVRDKLGVHSPRQITAKYLTPLLQTFTSEPRDTTQETLELIRALKRESLPVLTVLAHPLEMYGAARMTFREIGCWIEEMALAGILDGMEVRNPRDNEAAIKEWRGIWQSIRVRLQKRGREFFAFRYNSDFHILDPGKISNAFILGYGLLDEDHPAGNLKAVNGWEAFRQTVCEYLRV